jgi:hypothetical protein
VIRYEDISAAIQVRHLQVEIGEAVSFQPEDGADEAADVMTARGFDQAPVIDAGRVSGIVRVAALRSGSKTVGAATEQIRTEHLVSADAPVSSALAWLVEIPCLFVLDGRRITGFFLEADLNKQPARTYFYLLVASLEAGLAQALRGWVGADEARLLGVMPARMRNRVLKTRDEARRDDVDADLVAFLLFSDILRIVGAVAELRSWLGARGSRHWHKETGRLVGLRNSVMHPTRELVGRERSLTQLIELDARLRGLIQRLEVEPPADRREAPVALDLARPT